MYDINNHIKKELFNEYKGSERKKTVILDNNKKYMLKLSDPIREKGHRISYINNAYSEYLGCKIAKSIGLPVQEVILGNYTYINKNGEKHTRPACLCEDLREDNEVLLEIDTLSLSDYEDTTKELTLQNVNNKINHIKNIDKEKMKEFYYNMFVFDALTGNTDRHNGNWGIITDKYSTYVKIAPIYDCGSSLLPLIGDDDLPLKNKDTIFLSICSAISENNKKINYFDYLINIRNKDIDKALLRLIPKINLQKINNIILDTSDFSKQRKLMYLELIDKRYNNILISALQNIFKINEIKTDYKDINLYEFYKKNIAPISKSELYNKINLNLYDNKYELIKINNKYAIFLDNGICSGLLPIRSNNREISKAIFILCNQSNNTNILDKIKIDYANYNKEEEEFLQK